jgi:hypothetical protein
LAKNLVNRRSPPRIKSQVAPLLVGLVITSVNIIVHALILGMIVAGVRRDLMRGRVAIRFVVTIVMNATLLLLAAHFVEMALWGLSFVLCGEFSNFGNALYYSAASYTTLGDNTMAMSARWRLLGPFEAADGMLMFGVSTAAIFAVIQRFVQTRFEAEDASRLKTG